MDVRKEWEGWIEGVIANEVFTMHLQRSAWLRMSEIIRENPPLQQTPSYLWDWLFDLYAKTQAQAIRRQADLDRRAVSLSQIMVGLAKQPAAVTQADFVGRAANDEDPYWQHVAKKEWAHEYGGGEHFDPAIAEADNDRLQKESEKVRDYVNKHVAHIDAETVKNRAQAAAAPEGSEEQLPTLEEVHAGIDLVGEMFQKYGGLLTGKAWIDLTPVIQHDWEAVFRVPWIKAGPDETQRAVARWKEARQADKEAPDPPD